MPVVRCSMTRLRSDYPVRSVRRHQRRLAAKFILFMRLAFRYALYFGRVKTVNLLFIITFLIIQTLYQRKYLLVPLRKLLCITLYFTKYTTKISSQSLRSDSFLLKRLRQRVIELGSNGSS